MSTQPQPQWELKDCKEAFTGASIALLIAMTVFTVAMIRGNTAAIGRDRALCSIAATRAEASDWRFTARECWLAKNEHLVFVDTRNVVP